MENVSFLAAFAAGLLSFFSPCVLPLIPSYLSFITGITFKELEGPSPSVHRTTLINSLFFVMGFSFVFISLGVAINLLGHTLISIKEYVRIGGGVLIVFFGLFLMGLFNSRSLNRYFKLNFSLGRKSLFGSFLTGTIFAAGWTPCVGPILGSILVLAGTASTLYNGVALLCSYCLGLAVPFILSSLMINGFISFIPRIARYMNIITAVSGVLLVIAGVMLIFNMFGSLSGI